MRTYMVTAQVLVKARNPDNAVEIFNDSIDDYNSMCGFKVSSVYGVTDAYALDEAFERTLESVPQETLRR